MKQYVVSPEADKAAIITEITNAAQQCINLIPMAMYAKPRKEHLLKRLQVFLAVAKELVAASNKTMQICIQYQGESFYLAHYLEVQLVDKKNTIVYAAAVLDDN